MIEAVIADLTRALARGELAVALRARLRAADTLQLDGRPLALEDGEALRAAIVAWVRRTALPALSRVYPGDALRLLDDLHPHLGGEIAAERAALEAERRSRFPPPPAAEWPELARLRALAERAPEHCRLGPPATHVEWAARLAARGRPVPAELVELRAAHDGLELRDPSDDGDDESEAEPRLVVLPGDRLVDADVVDLADPGGLRARLAAELERLEAALGPRARDDAPRSLDPGADFAAMMEAGELVDALALCRAQVARWHEEAASCLRAGEGGEATRAERAAERWSERAREVTARILRRRGPIPGRAR